LDGMALRVTTDQACGGADSTLNPVPLTDTYDAAKLQFVSAEPAQDSVSTGAATPYANTGVITWDNLGPLYAGETQVVTVTFMALEPAGNVQTTITNDAAVHNAKFADGRSVHEASDSVTTNLDPTANIGDFVWSDLNGDGVQDPGEPGIPGVTVNLTLPGGSVISTVTDANGWYEFPGLADGSYTVAVDTTSLPGSGSAVQTGDPDATLDDTGTAVIASSTDIDTMDFGYNNVPAVIFGTVWEDNDGDGAQESGENGLAGVTVELQDGVCTPGATCPTTTTDADGNYQFEASGGSYTIAILTGTLPSGGSWSQTDDPDATLDDVHALTISAGDVSGSHDFGYFRSSGPYTLGDTIYTDWNGDGAQGSDEPGLSGVDVLLLSRNTTRVR
ncbi:MAG: SdrD B-like domain-containing protein, partial [Anaerolineae bacterium]